MGKYIATTSAAVSNYIEQMKKNLAERDYGKVGIIFKVHNGKVTYVQEINEKGYQLGPEKND